MNQALRWNNIWLSDRAIRKHVRFNPQWINDQERQERFELAYTLREEYKLFLLISSQPIKSSLITGTIIHEAIEQSIKYGFVLINTEPPESNLITREELLINPPKQPDDCTFKPHHKKKTKRYF